MVSNIKSAEQPPADGIQIAQPDSTVQQSKPVEVPSTELREVSAEVKDFYNRYSKAMEAWIKEHGKRPLPIVEVPVFRNGKPVLNEDGTPKLKLIWVNRDSRKKMRKEQMKQAKKAARLLDSEKKD